MSKKRTSVSHSSTESEVISLDEGLPMGGIPALDLIDFGIEVLHSSSCQVLNRAKQPRKRTNNKTKDQNKQDNLLTCTSPCNSSHQ